MPGETAPVTAIVTAYDRIGQAVTALQRIRACVPGPAEVLVHVDAGQQACARALEDSGLADQVLVSASRVGPGGGRNRLLAAARHEVVASFDDDSWPIDADYFARLLRLFENHPQAAVMDAALFHRGEARREAVDHVERSATFVGAGCAYRRDAFLATGGYVPLATAYGMEEVDLAIRLHARGERIFHADSLRVEHDTDLSHHGSAEVTSASIANIALLACLRYPLWMWPVGVVQVIRRVWWLLRHDRSRGVARGIVSIPAHVYAHWAWRSPLPAATVRSYLALRRRQPEQPA